MKRIRKAGYIAILMLMMVCTLVQASGVGTTIEFDMPVHNFDESVYTNKLLNAKIVTGYKIEGAEGGRNDIEAYYPQIEGLNADIEAREKIIKLNSVIKKEALRFLENESLYHENALYYFMDYDIEFINDSLLSIYYRARTAALPMVHHDYPLAFGVTINLEDKSTVPLSDVITDIDALADLLINDKFEQLVSWHDGGVTPFNKTRLGGYTTEALVTMLKAVDSYRTDESLEWYITDDGLVVIVNGRYFERYFIAYAEIKDFLNMEFLERYINTEVEHDAECAGTNPINFTNPGYEMFYGEWEATGRVFIDPMPVRGIYYGNDEIDEAIQWYAERIGAKKIQFTPENVVINGVDVIDNIRYIHRIFPANDDYKIHFTMTLKDIGLTESEGQYFVFVEVETKQGEHFEESRFFIKDKNTLIAYMGAHCVEYSRVSYDGGSEDPVIILG